MIPLIDIRQVDQLRAEDRRRQFELRQAWAALPPIALGLALTGAVLAAIGWNMGIGLRPGDPNFDERSFRAAFVLAFGGTMSVASLLLHYLRRK